ncbi:MAG: hypothetical protein QM820_26385 [Minicystis sp.]
MRWAVVDRGARVLSVETRARLEKVADEEDEDDDTASPEDKAAGSGTPTSGGKPGAGEGSPADLTPPRRSSSAGRPRDDASSRYMLIFSEKLPAFPFQLSTTT